MARKALVFWLLQFLSVIIAANAGSNATLDNCADFDMANVEDLISALRAAEDPKIETDDGGQNLEPFGHFKSDWRRLHLLQKALPEDSILKDKFKHIFRLLTVAHDQATRVSIPSQSTKIQDDFVNQSTISLDKEDHKDAEEIDGKSLGTKSQEIREKWSTSTTPISGITRNISDPNTTPRTSNFTTLSPESSKNSEDAVVMKNITEASVELDEDKEITMSANTTDLESTIKSLVTTAAPIPSLKHLMKSSRIVAAPISTLDPSMKSSVTTATSFPTVKPLAKSLTTAAASFSTLHSAMKSSVTTEAPSPSLEFRKPSTASSVLMPVATVSKDEIKSSTSTHNELKQTSETLFAATEEKANSTEKATKQYSTQTTEKILKHVFTESSISEEYSSIETTPSTTNTDIQSLNSTSNKNDSLSATVGTKIDNWPQSATTAYPADRSTTEEYSSTTLSKLASLKNQSMVPVTGDKLLTSSTQNPTKNISLVSFTPSTLLTNKFTADLEKKEKSSSSSAKVFSAENISTVGPAAKEDEEIELKPSNNRTENLLSVNPTLSVRKTTDFVEDASNITSITEGNRRIELTTKKNQDEVSIGENSTADARKTVNSPEKISSITPSIIDSAKVTSTSQNNQTETPLIEKSTVYGWRSGDPTGSGQTTIPSTKVKEDTKSISTNNETLIFTSEKSIPEVQDDSSTPKSTSVSTTSQLSTNITKLVVATEVTISPDKITHNSASTESPTKATESETSTRNYVDDQSTIPTGRNDVNVSKDIGAKATPEILKAQLTTEKNPGNNQTDLEVTSKDPKDNLGNSAPVTETSALPSDSQSWFTNTKPNFVTKANTEMPTAQLPTEKNPGNNQTNLEVTSKDPTDNLGNSAPVTETSTLPSHSQSWFTNTKPNFVTKINTEMPTAQLTTEKNPGNNQTNLEVTSKDPTDNLGNSAPVTETSALPSHSQNWFTNTKPNFVAKATTEMPTAQSTMEKNPGNSQTNLEVTFKDPKDNLGNSAPVTQTSELPSHSQSWFTNTKPNFETKANTEIPKDQLTTEKNPGNSQKTNLEVTSKDPKNDHDNATSVTETSEQPSHSQNWPIKKSKPDFMKNALIVGSSRGNRINWDIKHGSDDKIVLDKNGAGVKAINSWKPQFSRPTPAGNNIRLFDGFRNNGGPYGYGYRPPAPPDNGKAEKDPAKFPALGSRKNLVRSRKRGSANADVEKQFRSFYRQRKSRVKESDNKQINIQCKKPQQPH